MFGLMTLINITSKNVICIEKAAFYLCMLQAHLLFYKFHSTLAIGIERPSCE
jgi:hypothetical protein